MRLRIVFEPCEEVVSPPAGECSPEFMRWVREYVAARPGVMLAEWVPDDYPFAHPGIITDLFADLHD